MPRKPKRPCSYPGCPKLVDGRFCEEHQRIDNKNYEKYGRKYKPHKRYGRTWRKIRNKYIKEHPLCEMCLEDGRAKTAEEVHHIKPISEGGDHNEKNLKSLCKSCHSKIHAEAGDRFGKNIF